MNLHIEAQRGVPIRPGMIGLFFEDINYAADGGLYAEMLENRSFAFLDASGDWGDYYTAYDGGYAWSPYPAANGACLRLVSGSPLNEANPHYLRVQARAAGAGFANKAFDGICLQKGLDYRVEFFARCVRFGGNFQVFVEKEGLRCAQGSIAAQDGTEETANFFRRYQLTLHVDRDVTGGRFVLCLDGAGTVEFAFISMFPGDAVAGLFRKDLFEKLRDLHPGFLRFPGGCIVEGNTLANRYRYKDSLHAPWARKNNWNRWAVHNNCADNGYHSPFSHYNQSLGLGYYEYFVLCELLGAQPLPVLSVGFACQYQSAEMYAIDSPAFQDFVQDALDLIAFANDGPETKWGAVRAAMGHAAPFGLRMLGIGNEQWQTDKADFFERYVAFERAIHAVAPEIQLIGSAGPDITSERYTAAWDFYHAHEQQADFVYAVDEHYYVKPQWLYAHVDFYDSYPRSAKVFAGEYAAHPVSGLTVPQANTLEGALAEAAFLTGVERNADVVVLASYAPLFARLGYTQWAPDMIWFDGSRSFATPSYYVQKLYAENLGDVTLCTGGREKAAAKDGLYYSLSLCERAGEIILKIVNANAAPRPLALALPQVWQGKQRYRAQILSGDSADACNTLECPDRVGVRATTGKVADGITLPALSFAVIRIS